jgi:polysaccharide export outer membrane protein
MRFLKFTVILFTTIFFISGGWFCAELSAQNLMDRRGTQTQQTQPPSLDISRAAGTFYYVDQLGLSLGVAGLGISEPIDTKTYRLGPGDLLSISVSGGVNGVFRGLLINPQGELIIPNVGTVSLEGLLIDEAREVIAEAVKSKFLDTETQVSIERPRMIQVHIVGDIPFGGGHIIPSQTRLDKAIVRSIYEPRVTIDRETGETIRTLPSLNRQIVLDGMFSMRDIRITRNGRELSTDLVSYVLSGELENNPILEHGDIIRIRNRQTYIPQVSVSGAVKSPLLLEYRVDDSVAGLLEMAGGLSVDANTDEIEIIRRLQDGSVTRIKVSENDYMTPLQANDRLVVGFDRDRRAHQSAWVHGEAASPGNFPVIHGETTALELLEMAGGLTDNALPQAAFLVRANPLSNHFDGENADKKSNRLMRERSMVSFSESVNIEDNPRIREILMNAPFSAERLKRVSDQFIEGFEYLNLESVLNRNEVYIDLNNPSQLSSVLVYGGDELYIPRDEKTVFLFGQVNNPGYYAFENGKSAVDYVRSAGGYARAADIERLFVIKAGNMAWYPAGEATVESGDIIFVDREPFDTLIASRQFEFQKKELRNRNIQLIFSGIATVASVITAYIAITR